MTDLVTDAAELAAAHVMDDPHQIEIALRAAAPFIAAEALRQAGKQYGDLNLAEWEKDRVRNYLTARADELERDA